MNYIMPKKGILSMHSSANVGKNGDSYIIFDKVDGRYLYSEIRGKYEILEIQEYYKKVLPNLGWKFFEKNSFVRADEILEIQYLIDDEETKVVFTISPKK